MATLMWIKTKDKPHVVPFERAMLPESPLGLKGLNAPRYLIAKGNIINGIEAKW